MKVAIITLGLLETMLPLVRHMRKKAEIDLYISVYGNRFSDSISTFDLSGLPFGMVDEKATEKVIGEKLLQYIGQDGNQVKVKLFRYPSLKIFNRQNHQLHKQFAKAINEQNYDAVHFNGYRGSLLFLYAFLKRKTGKVWTIHDPIQHSGEVKWQTVLGYKSYRFLKAHFILHNRTQLPEFIKEYKINPARVHFVGFGPQEAIRIFENGQIIETDPNTVLFYGRISPYKGVEYLIEAALKAKKQLPELKVIIAGKPNYPIDLESVRNDPSFEIRDRFIENKELVSLIRQAMVDMLKNRETLSTMQQNLKERIRDGKFSWDRIADQTLEVYHKSLVGKKRRR